MRRAFLGGHRTARTRLCRLLPPQYGQLLAQPRQFLAELQHGAVLLALMALEVGVAFLQPRQSIRFTHPATMWVAGPGANPTVPAP